MSLTIPINALDLESIEQGDPAATAAAIRVMTLVLNQLSARPRSAVVQLEGSNNSQTEDGLVEFGTFHGTDGDGWDMAGLRIKHDVPAVDPSKWIIGTNVRNHAGGVFSIINEINAEGTSVGVSPLSIIDVTGPYSPAPFDVDYIVAPGESAGHSLKTSLGIPGSAEHQWSFVAAREGYYEQDRSVLMGHGTAYTPTWSVNGGTTTLGDGTLTGKYAKVGNLVVVEIHLVYANNTSTSGAGFWHFSLPSTPVGIPIGNAVMIDSGIARYPGQASINSGDTIRLFRSSDGVSVTATAPFTFGTNDSIQINAIYFEA